VHDPSRTKKRAAAAAAATAAIGSAGLAAISAAPAMAAHPISTCPGNTLCAWRDANFEGPVKWFRSALGTAGRVDNYRGQYYDSNTTVPMDPNGPLGSSPDNISSVWNNSGHWVTMCNNWFCRETGANDTEFGLCLGPDKAVSYLGMNGAGWNDVISSHRTGTAPDHCRLYAGQEGCSL
jgi:hypothetical protein